MVKSIKVWLVLIPVILIIGVALYMQSYQNQIALESQLIRSVEVAKKDVARALSDYYVRMDAYFTEVGSAKAAITRFDGKTKIEYEKIAAINQLNLKYSNPRLVNISSQFNDSITIKNGFILKKGLIINIENLTTNYKLTSFREAFNINDNPPNNKGDTILIMDVQIPISELLRKQNTNRIFEHFYITNSEGVILEPKDDAGIKLFQPKEIKPDSLGVTNSGTDILQLNYSGNPSRAYITTIPIENQVLFAVGFISESAYHKVGMRLDFGKLSTLILFLLILLAMIPILGVLNLSPGDNLTQSKVTLVGISLLCLTIIIGYTISQFKNKLDPIAVQTAIVAKLEEGFKESLEEYKNTLQTFGNFENLGDAKTNFNEIIRFRPNGYSEKIFFKNAPKEYRLIDFGSDTSSINLSHREYYIFFKKSENLSKTFLNSHYSQTDGKLESVISKNFDYADTKSEKSKIKGLNAITFKFNTDSILSEKYRFLVLKEGGKILLMSNKISSPIATLQEGINSDKWKEICSLMKNNKTSDLPIQTSLYLNGNYYTGLLQRVKTDDYDEKVWVLFLVNENLNHAFSSLISAESIVLLGVYFLSLIFSLVIQKYSRRTHDILGSKAFLYSWLEPNSYNLPRLKYLTVTYLFYALTMITIYYCAKIRHTEMLLLLIYSSSLISFVNLSTSISTASFIDFTEFRLQKYSIRTIILAGVNFTILLFIAARNEEILYSSLVLTLLACLIIAGWFLIYKSKVSAIKQHKGFTIPTFLAMWFLIIGFLPGYFLQSKTQYYEEVIWNSKAVNNVPVKANTSPDSIEFYNMYELQRRAFFTLLADPFDEKILNFIAPDQQVFKNAIDKANLSTPTIPRIIYNLMLILTVLLLFILFGNILQGVIFYPFYSLKRNKIDFSKSKLFLCCSQSSTLSQLLSDEQKFKKTTFKWINLIDNDLSKIDLLDTERSHYFIQNIHCLKNQLDIVPLLNDLMNKGKFIIISSGKSWNDLFFQINTIDDQIRYSETFTEFDFYTIPIKREDFVLIDNKKNLLLNLAEIQDKMQLQIAHFADIWSELNFQEKLICYSFATERFFNKSRKDTIQQLIRKGIFIEDFDEFPQEKNTEAINSGKTLSEILNEQTAELPQRGLTPSWHKYEFFNRLFHTYILTHISREEIKSFQDFERKNGNSKMIQISAISFVMICFALISVFDKTFLNEIYAYLTGTLGLLGSLYAILNRGFSGFNFGKTEPKS